MKKLFLAVLILTYAGCLYAQTPSIGNNGRYGFVEDGDVVIPYIYEYASDFNEGLAVVCKSSRFGFIDRTGKTVIPFEYRNSHAVGFSEGVCGVSKNGKKWFFIDKSGQRINDKEYLRVMPYKSGMAAVFIDDNTAVFVDKSGRRVIDAEFAYAETFHDGIAVAGKLNNSRSRLIYGFIDTKGNWLSNSFYDEIYSDIGTSPFDANGIVMVQKGSKTGYVNRQMQFFDSMPSALTSVKPQVDTEANISSTKEISGKVEPASVSEPISPRPYIQPKSDPYDLICGKFYRITYTDFRTKDNPDHMFELSIELAWASVGKTFGCVMTWGDENGADMIDVFSFSKRYIANDGAVVYSNDEGEYARISKEDNQGRLVIKPKDRVEMTYIFNPEPLDQPFVKREFR